MEETPPLEKLKVLYTNADSLLNKMNELETLLSNNQYDIVAITETLHKNRANSNPQPVEFNLEEFNMYMEDIEGYEGRGVRAYVNNRLRSAQVSLVFHRIEHISIEIATKNEWTLFQCIYRSPSSNNNSVNDLEAILSLSTGTKPPLHA